MARISVVLPVHNGERWLRGCIDSVLSQTLADFEVVVGDDASSDASRSILAGVRDPRIRIFHWPSRLGLFRNLNRLLREVTAPLVHFLCQDDWLRVDCLEKEVRFFGAHTNVGMSFCKAVLVDDSNRVIVRGAIGDLPTVIEPWLSLQHFFYHGCIPGNLSTVCTKLASIRAAGAFDESFLVAGDYEAWTRLCRSEHLGVLHDHLVYVRMHSGQLSRACDSGARFVEECRRVRSRLLGRFPARYRRRARLYGQLRHNVLDAHYCVRSLFRGDMREAWLAARALGLRDLVLGLIAWCFTLNNRVWRPTPPFADEEIVA